jgi:hypothetical protein
MKKLFNMLVVLSLTSCAIETGDEEFGVTEQHLVEGQHYCVIQSTASAFRNNSFWGPLECSVFNTSLPINTALSRNHPVRVERYCTDRVYVNVLSLWTGSYYMMRADALGGC